MGSDQLHLLVLLLLMCLQGRWVGFVQLKVILASWENDPLGSAILAGSETFGLTADEGFWINACLLAAMQHVRTCGTGSVQEPPGLFCLGSWRASPFFSSHIEVQPSSPFMQMSADEYYLNCFYSCSSWVSGHFIF